MSISFAAKVALSLAIAAAVMVPVSEPCFATSVNGLVPNALVPNALVPNALVPNALVPNALVPNGSTTNFMTLQAVRLALPDGAELTFR